MSENNHILLVDDDNIMLALERKLLGEDKYRFSIASNGLDALDCIAADKPEVILLDVMMPEMDGLETCRRIRAEEDYSDIHILFVTARDDEETRLTAYEAGGDEVLTKPINGVVLNRKVEAALRNQAMVRGLREEMASTMGILMSTIVTSGEYGVVMGFFRNSYACGSIAELAEMALRALDDFSLSGSVQLRAGSTVLTLNTERRSSPIEQEMLLKLSLGNRHIYDYGSRTAFCYPNVAILIKSMPLDDPDAYGRIKDNVALLAEGAEFRLRALRQELAVKQQREYLIGSVQGVSEVLRLINTEYKSGQSEMSGIFAELEQRLEWVFAGLGLSDQQEKGIWDAVHPLISQSAQLYDKGVQLDERLNQALTGMRASLEKCFIQEE